MNFIAKNAVTLASFLMVTAFVPRSEARVVSFADTSNKAPYRPVIEESKDQASDGNVTKISDPQTLALDATLTIVEMGPYDTLTTYLGQNQKPLVLTCRGQHEAHQYTWTEITVVNSDLEIQSKTRKTNDPAFLKDPPLERVAAQDIKGRTRQQARWDSTRLVLANGKKVHITCTLAHVPWFFRSFEIASDQLTTTTYTNNYPEYIKAEIARRDEIARKQREELYEVPSPGGRD